MGKGCDDISQPFLLKTVTDAQSVEVTVLCDRI